MSRSKQKRAEAGRSAILGHSPTPRGRAAVFALVEAGDRATSAHGMDVPGIPGQMGSMAATHAGLGDGRRRPWRRALTRLCPHPPSACLPRLSTTPERPTIRLGNCTAHVEGLRATTNRKSSGCFGCTQVTHVTGFHVPDQRTASSALQRDLNYARTPIRQLFSRVRSEDLHAVWFHLLQ